MSDLGDRALETYRVSQDRSEDTKLEMLRTRRGVCTRYAAGVLEVDSGCLDLEMEYGRRKDPKLWLFRHQGMSFYVKFTGGDRPCELFVVSDTGGGLPFRTLQQLGMWIHKQNVTVHA